jgi:hypothetical protein
MTREDKDRDVARGIPTPPNEAPSWLEYVLRGWNYSTVSMVGPYRYDETVWRDVPPEVEA